MENAERGYTIERTFDAPRALVWRAWTDPARFARWFGGPDIPMEDVRMDARPGGEWQGRMLLPGGTTKDWWGRFEDIDEPRRLVLSFTDEPANRDDLDRFTVTLEEIEGRTRMTLRQSGGHLTDEEYGQAKRGTQTFLDELDALLRDDLKMRHDGTA